LEAAKKTGAIDKSMDKVDTETYRKKALAISANQAATTTDTDVRQQALKTTEAFSQPATASRYGFSPKNMDAYGQVMKAAANKAIMRDGSETSASKDAAATVATRVGGVESVKAAAAFRRTQAQERINEANKVMDETNGRVQEAQIKLGDREAVRAGLVEEGIKVPPALDRSIATMKNKLDVLIPQREAAAKKVADYLSKPEVRECLGNHDCHSIGGNGAVTAGGAMATAGVIMSATGVAAAAGVPLMVAVGIVSAGGAV